MKLEFSLQIFGKTQMSNFIKIRQVGVESFHASFLRGGKVVLDCSHGET